MMDAGFVVQDANRRSIFLLRKLPVASLMLRSKKKKKKVFIFK